MAERRGTLRADLLLLVTAAIWGFAFVAQRAGMQHLGPFWFNAVRFALGCLLLLPVALRRSGETGPRRRSPFIPGLMAGCVLFAGASLQQTGLIYTSAANAGFVTGLYVVFVPLLGLLRGRRTPRGIWFGAAVAAGGMFLLSSSGTTSMVTGDLLVLAGAVFWAIHIQMVSSLVHRTAALKLAVMQFAVCSLLSLGAALITEEISKEAIRAAALPLLYGGFVSVGIAYTLQVVAQRKAHPAHAAVIMSLEALFAAIGGWLVLGEKLEPAGIAGCILMFSAMMISVISSNRSRRDRGTPRRLFLYNH